MEYDWLYNEYVVKNRSTLDIANEYGCKRNTIQCWLRKHNIKKDKVDRQIKHNEIYQNKEYLYESVVMKNKTIMEIAKENNVSYDTVNRYIHKFNIPRPYMNRRKYSQSDIKDIINLYVNKRMSANQISKKYGTNHSSITKVLKSNGIEIRDPQLSQFTTNQKKFPSELLDSDWLYDMHWIENKSCKEIGKVLNIDARCVRNQMHKFGIKTRNNSESKVGLMTGERHPNWKGGITSLNLLLREYSMVNLSPIIKKRDNYKCQICGDKSSAIHVHHIKPFSEVVYEIMQEYPELDVTDENMKQKLYDIIVKDKRFNDPDNLITLCKDCHLYKVHKYNRKTISSQAS